MSAPVPDARRALWLEAEAVIASDPVIPRAAAYLEGFLDPSAREVLREALVQSFLAGRTAELHDRRAALRHELTAHGPSAAPVVLEGPARPVARPPYVLGELDAGLLRRLWAWLVRAVGRRRA